LASFWPDGTCWTLKACFVPGMVAGDAATSPTRAEPRRREEEETCMTDWQKVKVVEEREGGLGRGGCGE